MTNEQALYVKRLFIGDLGMCSWRKLSEEYYTKYPDDEEFKEFPYLKGDQYAGMSLVMEASSALGESEDSWYEKQEKLLRKVYERQEKMTCYRCNNKYDDNFENCCDFIYDPENINGVCLKNVSKD